MTLFAAGQPLLGLLINRSRGILANPDGGKKMAVSAGPIGGIILAAGSSKRFGADKRRQRLPGGNSLLEETIRSARHHIETILVVLRQDDDFGDRLNEQMNDPHIRFYCAPDSAQGMGASLANAMAQIDAWQAALIILGDMPYIRQSTFKSLLDAYQPDSQAIILPVNDNIPGHPVLFDQYYFAELSKLWGDHGARPILEAHNKRIIHVEVDDPGIWRDIDTAEDIDAV